MKVQNTVNIWDECDFIYLVSQQYITDFSLFLWRVQTRHLQQVKLAKEI